MSLTFTGIIKLSFHHQRFSNTCSNIASVEYDIQPEMKSVLTVTTLSTVDKFNKNLHILFMSISLAYQSDLEADVKGDTSGEFREMLIQRLGTKQTKQEKPNKEEAEEDAKKLQAVRNTHITSN